MATAINSARTDYIKFETNVPQTFALKYSTGKEVGEHGNVMFSTVDGGRLFLNPEDTSEFEHALSDLQYKPGEPIRVTRVKHGKERGGGFAIRVERTQQTEREWADNLEQKLQASVRARTTNGSLRNANGSARALTDQELVMAGLVPEKPASAIAVTPAGTAASKDTPSNGSANGAAAHPPAAEWAGRNKFACAYGRALGLLVDFKAAYKQHDLGPIRLEDIRALAATILIDDSKCNGGGR